jgi:hypothetical protein
MRRYWSEVAPPPNITLVAVAAGLGVDMGLGAASAPVNQDDALAELLSMIPERPSP